MEYKAKLNTVEDVGFKFVAWNVPHLQTHTKMCLFKFSRLLSLTLKKSVLYDIKHGKKQLERNIKIGIRLGEISVMRLDSTSKKRYY